MPNGPGRPLLAPRPRRSGAMRLTAPTNLSATQGQAACDPVMPYTASTGGPLPHRATKRSPPVTGTVR